MPMGPLYILPGKMSVQVLCPFFNRVFCFPGVGHVCSLYILEIKPLSEVSFANIFSHMVGSLSILLMLSLAMQKLFILMKSHVFILSFMSLALREMLVKILLRGISEIFLPMFSSRTFMVSQLIFKSFIHLEFIFVYVVIWWSSVNEWIKKLWYIYTT